MKKRRTIIAIVLALVLSLGLLAGMQQPEYGGCDRQPERRDPKQRPEACWLSK